MTFRFFAVLIPARRFTRDGSLGERSGHTLPTMVTRLKMQRYFSTVRYFYLCPLYCCSVPWRS